VKIFINLLANIFHVAVHLFSTWWQKVAHKAIVKGLTDVFTTLWCHLWWITEQIHSTKESTIVKGVTDVFTTLWCHLWSITEQMHSTKESTCICFFIIKLITNRWAWDLVPYRLVEGLSNSGTAGRYPWQSCKQEPSPHHHTEKGFSGQYLPNPILTDHKGREGVGARIRYDSFKLRTKALKKAVNLQQSASNWSATISKAIDPQRSTCKVTQNKAGHKAQRSMRSPAGHVRLIGETADRIGSGLTLPKLH